MSKARAMRKLSWAPSPRGGGSRGAATGRRVINPRNVGRAYSAPKTPPLSVPRFRPFGGVPRAAVPFGKRVPIAPRGMRIPWRAVAGRAGWIGAGLAAGAALWPYMSRVPDQPWGGGYHPGKVKSFNGNSILWPYPSGQWPYPGYSANWQFSPDRFRALPHGRVTPPSTSIFWIDAYSPQSPDGDWVNLGVNKTAAQLVPPYWKNAGTEWIIDFVHNGKFAGNPPDPQDISTWGNQYAWYHWLRVRIPKASNPSPELPPSPIFYPGIPTGPADWPMVPQPNRPAVLPGHSPFPAGIPWPLIPVVRPFVTEPVPYPNGEGYLPPVEIPDGVVVVGPSPTPSPVAKPGHNVRERKARTNNDGLLAAFKFLQGKFHQLTEASDAIDAVYDALPKWVRKRAEKDGKLNPAEKAAVIYNNMRYLDVDAAVKNLLYNQVEDYVIGKGFKSVQDAADRLGIKGAYKLDQPVLEALDMLMGM